MIFVDSGAWFAITVPGDADHAAAKTWFHSNDEQLVTSDYVVGETLTLLRARGERRYTNQMGQLFFDGKIATVYHVSPSEFAEAWHIFRDYKDKEWSFTDCTSKVLMQRLGIKRAFAFDHHFRQFGDIEMVP